MGLYDALMSAMTHSIMTLDLMPLDADYCYADYCYAECFINLVYQKQQQ